MYINLHFKFLVSLCVSSGYIPSSALDNILVVALEHLGTILPAVLCTVSYRSTNLVFPFYSPPEYSIFGTITFIRIHLLILVSRCESVKIASILLTCALRFPIAFPICVYIPRAVF